MLQGLVSALIVSLLFGGCEDTEVKKVEDTKAPTKVEEQVERVTIMETDTEAQYKVLNDLNEEQFNQDLKVELTGTVKRIEDKDETIEFLLDFDTNTSDYTVMAIVPTNLMKDGFEVGDTLTVQGRLGETNVDAFLDGYTENGDGVHIVKLSAYNIYK